MISYEPMGMKCANCGKGIMYGHNVSHSKRRTRRIFRPNLHRSRVIVNGRSMTIKLCTKCLRMFKRATETVKKEINPVQQPQMVN